MKSVEVDVDGSKFNFDIESYAKDNGLSISEIKGRSGFKEGLQQAVGLKRADVTARVSDEAGHEYDFDIFKAIEDQTGGKIDRGKFLENEQINLAKAERAQKMSDINAFEEKYKDNPTMAKIGAFVPNSLKKIDKIKNDPSMSTGRATYELTKSLVWDQLHHLNPFRYAIGGLDKFMGEATQNKYGKPFLMSLSETADYGADETEMPDGSKEEESLTDHMENLKEAFRLDPINVTYQLAKESARDPLMAASAIASTVGLPTEPVVLARFAKTIEKVTRGIVASSKASKKAKILAKAAEYIAKAPLYAVDEAIGEGLQGSFANYMLSDDKNIANTFIIEAVEGGVMSPLFHLAGSAANAPFQLMRKADQIKAGQHFRNKARVEAGKAPDMPEFGEPIWNEEKQEFDWVRDPDAQEQQSTAIEGEVVQPTEDTPAKSYDNREIGVVEKAAQVDGLIPTGRPGTNLTTTDPGMQSIMGPEGQIGHYPVDRSLPANISRTDAIKKLYNPGYATHAEKESDARNQVAREQVKKDVKHIKKTLEDGKLRIAQELDNALKSAAKEIDNEDRAQMEANGKIQKEIESAVSEIEDPTKPTSYKAWSQVFGKVHENATDRRKAFEDFHINEQKKIKTIRKKISPKEKQASDGTPASNRGDNENEEPNLPKEVNNVNAISTTDGRGTPSESQGLGETVSSGEPNGGAVSQLASEGDRPREPRGRLSGGVSTKQSQSGVDGTVKSDNETPGKASTTTEEPATEEPATEEPATEEPATEEPATEEPAAEELVVKDKSSDLPAMVYVPELRKNIKLRDFNPIELTAGKRLEINRKVAEIVQRLKTDPSSQTIEDRELMRQYTGSGGLGNKNLSDAEAEGLLNQHYTSYQVVKSLWSMIESLGFKIKKGTTALEPSAGIGNFIGFAPQGMKWSINELDDISGNVARFLYPEENVSVAPFEDYIGPKKDLVISNVPFLEFRGAWEFREKDPRYKGIKSLHDYFLMKMLDNLRDNGLGVFITSTYSADKQKTEFRKQFNQKAEILAVVRIPEGAFSKNTQYEGSADIIIVRKRTKGEIANVSAEDRLQPEWVESAPATNDSLNGKAVNRSNWFNKHPEHKIGEWKVSRIQGGERFSTQIFGKGEEFTKNFQTELDRVSETLKDKYNFGEGAETIDGMEGVGESLGKANPETPVFGLEITKTGEIAVKDRYGELHKLQEDDAKSKRGPTQKHLSVIVLLMEAAQELQNSVAKEIDLKPVQEHIKSLIERWKALPKYSRQDPALLPGVSKKTILDGDKRISRGLQFKDNGLQAIAGRDKRFSLIRTLYNRTLDGYSDLMTKSRPIVKPPEVKNPDLKTGNGLVDFLKKKYGNFRMEDAVRDWKGEGDISDALSKVPELNWDGEKFVHDDEYLVGAIKLKIDAAKKAGLTEQVKKLDKYLPEQKTIDTIEANPLASWWGEDAVSSFARELGLGSGYKIKRINNGLKSLYQAVNSSDKKIDPPQEVDNFVKFFMNMKNIQKEAGTDLDGNILYTDDLTATKKYREEIIKSFSDWAKSRKHDYADKAVENYNKHWAGLSNRKYSEDDVYIPGWINPRRPYPGQRFITRLGLAQKAYINAQGVGHGKTIGTIMSWKALKDSGFIKKAILIVPAGTMGMWRSNFMDSVAGVKVKLVETQPASQRRIDIMDAAANEYDIIILSHNTLKTIPLRASEKYIGEEIASLLESLRKAADDKSLTEASLTDETFIKARKLKPTQARVIKSIQKVAAKAKNKMNTIREAGKDMALPVFFEDFGANAMFVDEAHNFKNTWELTNEYSEKRFLKIGQGSSQSADDMVHKSRYINDLNGRGGMFFMTATPTPNDPIEIYRMIKMVAPWEWTNRGIMNIDDFISNFVNIGISQSSSVTGISAEKEQILGYRNYKALNDIVRTYVDYREASPEIEAARPKAFYTQPVIDPSESQIDILGEIAALDAMDSKALMDLGINPITLTTNAKNGAVDPAFVNIELVEKTPSFYDRSPKLRATMDNVEAEYKADRNGVQIVFLDLFNLRKWEDTIVDGNPVEWPSGFGRQDVDEETGKSFEPSWFQEFAGKAEVQNLINGEEDVSQWSSFLLDKRGTPKKLTEGQLESFKPRFDSETGKFYVQKENVIQNLHNEIAKYAIDKIGMPKERVYVVNGNSNNKPEDKTRLELMSEMGKISLIVGVRSVMSEGLNLQHGGRAIHHPDIPWNPKSLTQANGRMLRPRIDLSDKAPVKIYNYALKNSIDRRIYEILDKKTTWEKNLRYSDSDYIDNAINNIEEGGFNAGDLASSLAIPQSYVDGFIQKYQIATELKGLNSGIEDYRKINASIEKFKNQESESKRKIDDAKDRVEKANDKHILDMVKVAEYNLQHPESPKPDPIEPNHEYNQKIIANNTAQIESIGIMLETSVKNLASYGFLERRVAANRLAAELWTLGRENKFQDFADEDFDQFSSSVHSALPEMDGKFLGTMRKWAKAIIDNGGTKESFIEKAQEARKRAQAGFIDGKVLKLFAGLGAIATGMAMNPGLTVGATVGYGLFKYIYKPGSQKTIYKNLAVSVRTRINEMVGGERISRLVDYSNGEKKVLFAKYDKMVSAAFKYITDDDIAMQAADYAEGRTAPQEGFLPEAVKAGKIIKEVYRQGAILANQYGIPIKEDGNYYTRIVNQENIRNMKTDPALLTEQIKHLVDTKQAEDEVHARAILESYYDGTDEMRMERAGKRRAEILASLRASRPDLSDAALFSIYEKVRRKFGEKIYGSLAYGRKAPRLTDEMYYRDPREVLLRYIDGTVRSLVNRKYFGEGHSTINGFLNDNFKGLSREEDFLRDEVKGWINAELHGKRLAPVLGMGQTLSWNTVYKIMNFHYISKLALNATSPIRNVFQALPMSFAIAGIGNTVSASIRTLIEGVSGSFVSAGSAGAISERTMIEAFDLADSRKTKKTGIISKVGSGLRNNNLFTVTEKLIRSTAYMACVSHVNQSLDNLSPGGLHSKDALNFELKQLSEIMPHKVIKEFMAGVQPSKADIDAAANILAEKISGSGRMWDSPAFFSTPMGSLIFQFRKIAFSQTRVLYRDIIRPLFETKGLERSRAAQRFLAWAVGAGISAVVGKAIMSALLGAGDEKDKSYLWSSIQTFAYMNLLGWWGDMSTWFDDYSLQKASYAGPTVGMGVQIGKTAFKGAVEGQNFDAVGAAGALAKDQFPIIRQVQKFGR